MSELTEQELKQLQTQLTEDEGCEASAYQDSRGYWTIGIGRLIDKKLGGKLSPDEIQYLFRNDIFMAQHACMQLYPKFREFSAVRRMALINMAFNMGFARLNKFIRMRAAINKGDWAEAAKQARASAWYTQVGKRAERIVSELERG